MLRIGTVWDRTTEVIAGRLSILAAIAILLFFAPSAFQSIGAALGGQGVGSVLSLVALVLTIWGVLAITLVASDPANDRQAALAKAARRLPAGLGVLVVAMAVALLVALPGIYLFLSAGFDMDRARTGLPQESLDIGRAGIAVLYLLVYLIVALWISARLVPLFAVVANERRGLGAFARSFALTKGSTLKLIGVLILFVIVLVVASGALTAVAGTVLRLALGADSLVLVAAILGVLAAALAAVFSVLQNVFAAQFYVAARDSADPAA